MPKPAWGLSSSSFLSSTLSVTSRQTIRYASLTSAINRCKRKARNLESHKADKRENNRIVRYHRTRGEKYLERDAAESLEKEKQQIDEVASEEHDLPVL